MKLKKFAAMMLAGVMAVSMLAGCSGKGTNGGNNGEAVVPSTSSIVTAFNNGQDKDNKVKVTFTANSELDAALQKAVAMQGENVNEATTESNIGKLIGVGGTLAANGTFTLNNWNVLSTKATKDGQVDTAMDVEVYGNKTYWTEADALNTAARAIDDVIADLTDSTRKGTAEGDKYYDYSYTGTVSMVKVDKANGTSSYVVAYTITRTATEGKVEAK